MSSTEINMTKLTVAVHNFAKATKNDHVIMNAIRRASSKPAMLQRNSRLLSCLKRALLASSRAAHWEKFQLRMVKRPELRTSHRSAILDRLKRLLAARQTPESRRHRGQVCRGKGCGGRHPKVTTPTLTRRQSALPSGL